ncbi:MULTISPECIES: hypothetical protein [unclassified Siphonobacter]|uniref:hypothetical protein n=1 Tax=unclassified Siphonobacter TaxID=2635712 RepID=UPI002785CE47|nr:MULTISPECIES: hypothetical protein [unclassified Siphonobacter]MDQ1086847.1 hypothetical protein [Siphonobacter sp. SORGH_AS_1065]MDR6192955.1 hypothetical protein [Siphonobacter sp. SORGH_AS_0500]
METQQLTRPLPGEKSSGIHTDTPSETAQELELEKSMEENEGDLGLGDESSYPQETRKEEDAATRPNAIFPGSVPEVPATPELPEIDPVTPDIPGTFPDQPHAPEEIPDSVPEAPVETPPLTDVPEVTPDEIGETPEGLPAQEDVMPVPTAISEADQQNRIHPAF